MHTIFHAFNWSFAAICKELPWIARLGFSAVQISPAQRSFDGNVRESFARASCLTNKDLESSPLSLPEWYLRYQPLDYRVIEGLGSMAELTELCHAAASRNIIVIADLVFNHMGSVIDKHEAAQLWRSLAKGGKVRQQALQSLHAKLDAFPQFDHTDFHPFRPIDGHEYDNDDLRYTGWGGAGTWPDLKPTERVLQAQRDHITLLHSCGVRGFRFDAVKQMFAVEQYRPLVAHCRSLEGVQFVYGEVLSTRPQTHAEYAAEALTTDFLLMRDLVAAFAPGAHMGNLSALGKGNKLGCPAVVFARNHDTVMQYLPTLSFDSVQRAALATVFLLLTNRAPVLILADDCKDERMAQATEAALRLRGLLSETNWAKLPNLKVACAQSGEEMATCLWMILPGIGAVFFNASDLELEMSEVFVPLELYDSKVLDAAALGNSRARPLSATFFSRFLDAS